MIILKLFYLNKYNKLDFIFMLSHRQNLITKSVRFDARPLCPLEKGFQYSVDRRLGRPREGLDAVVKIKISPWGILHLLPVCCHSLH
jgi:hypothetical protein